MHCRFVKRFTISIILLSFGGLWLLSTFSRKENGGEDVDIKFPRAETTAESERTVHKRFFDAVKNILKSTIGDVEKNNFTFTEGDWIVDILDKNLSKYDTVERILGEIDKRIPDKYSDYELTVKSSTAQWSSTGQSSEAFTELAEIPTEPVKPHIHAHGNLTKRKPPDMLFPGFMNVHIWEAWCGKTVEDLRRNKHFPLYPDTRTVTTDLFVKQRALDFGQRIFGYLHPPQTGYFTFCLSSDDNSELWLSNSSDPTFVRKIAWVGNLTNPENTGLADFQRFRGQISPPVYLVEDRKYFVEILHKQASYMDHVLVAWKGPGISQTKMITEKYISAYIDEDELDQDVNLLAEYVPENIASSPTPMHGSFTASYLYYKNVSKFGAYDLRDDFHLTPMVDDMDFADMLPKCQYEPSYLVDFDVNRYEGVKLIHDTAVYPDDQTELTHMIPRSSCENRFIDSHMNLIRPTTPPDIDEEDLEEPTKGFTIAPKVMASLDTFQKRFKHVLADLKKYNSASAKRKAIYAKYIESLKNFKKLNRIDHVMKHKTDLGKRKEVLLDENLRKNEREKSKVEDAIKNRKLKKKRFYRRKVRKRKLVNSKKIVKSNNTYGKRRENDAKAKNVEKSDHSDNEVLLKKDEEISYEKDSSKKDNGDAPLDDYEAKLTGRRLLGIGGKKRFKYAYEVDDEGLEGTWSNNQRKAIFVPIDGVDNINKPLPVRKKYVRLKQTASPPRENNDDEDSDNQMFKLKQYYRRMNVTSHRDVTRLFKIYRYALYDLIEELPRIHTWKYRFSLSECRSDGNLLLNEKVASGVVKKYMGKLREKYKDKYTLKRIVNVEENHDVVKGDRYLIELDLKVKGFSEKSFRLSRYVYQKMGSLDLCEPTELQWNPHADVHVIVPVKNQGRWVQHFIDNMERIYLETLDPHLNIIIVDFNSTDINIEESLRKSKLKRYQLIQMDGPFQRALGVQAGADAVKNPEDIIFTCDLHLEIPSSLIDSIRKHCVLGKMAFAPIVLRLDCGYTPENPYGEWEIQGYGLFAICKADFDKAGGMNTKEFKTKWGGEDWEMLDRILTNGIEVERLRIPKFYHYFHSKKRMWNQ